MNPIDIITFKDPRSPVSEVYRTLRTNIKFMSFQKKIKTILITSAGPGEGKTTITANLGITMAQAGSKVLIIDCDLRNPSMHKKFSLSNGTGLTNILMGDKPYNKYICTDGVKNLYILPSGPKPPNPSELLDSEPMKELLEELKAQYDYVLIDTPPSVVVTDALLLSPICDGTIIVVASEQSDIETSVKAKELLVNVGANIIGAVNNKVKVGRAGGYYKYYKYEYTDKESRNKGTMNSKKRGTLDV